MSCVLLSPHRGLMKGRMIPTVHLRPTAEPFTLLIIMRGYGRENYRREGTLFELREVFLIFAYYIAPIMDHDIFISYSSKQKSVADGVCHFLEENGYKCWMAPRDIPAGSAYGDLIDEAIVNSKLVVLVFSQAAALSKWVKGEINVAFDENKYILPFRIDETKIAGGFRVMLNQMHWVDAFPHYAEKLPVLLESIRNLIGERRNPNERVVEKEPEINISEGMEDKDPKDKGETGDLEKLELAPQMEFSVKGVFFKMILVEGGRFLMGAADDDGDAELIERPRHGVTLSDYYIGETLVTQDLWQAVMGKNPSYRKGPDLPVDSVPWKVINEPGGFFDRLQAALSDQIPISWRFRAPTEAEWEYAARGGRKSNGYKYSGSDNIERVAWHKGNSEGKTHPVKQKEPNELGLYDMSGNVWEPCMDMCSSYHEGEFNDPFGPIRGWARASRGGAFDVRYKKHRVSYRGIHTSGHFSGLRLVLQIGKKRD